MLRKSSRDVTFTILAYTALTFHRDTETSVKEKEVGTRQRRGKNDVNGALLTDCNDSLHAVAEPGASARNMPDHGAHDRVGTGW